MLIDSLVKRHLKFLITFRKILLFVFLLLFLIASLTPFINKPGFSRILTDFIISFISSFENINVATPDLDIFLWIATSVVDAAVNPTGSKTLWANDLTTFFIKGNSSFSNGPKSLPKNTPDCTIVCNWVFDNFILADELFGKALQSLETCVLISNNVWGKLLSSFGTTFYQIFKVTSVPFFIPNFNF